MCSQYRGRAYSRELEFPFNRISIEREQPPSAEPSYILPDESGRGGALFPSVTVLWWGEGGAGLEYYYIYRGIMPSIKIPMPRIIDAIGTRDASHARQHMA